MLLFLHFVISDVKAENTVSLCLIHLSRKRTVVIEIVLNKPSNLQLINEQ